MTRFINRTLEACAKSDHKYFQMASLVFKGGKILTLAANKGRNHAEARALPRHMDFEGATIIIMRRNQRISKPCPKCMHKIRRAKIARMIYTNRQGKIIKERVYT